VSSPSEVTTESSEIDEAVSELLHEEAVERRSFRPLFGGFPSLGSELSSEKVGRRGGLAGGGGLGRYGGAGSSTLLMITA